MDKVVVNFIQSYY